MVPTLKNLRFKSRWMVILKQFFYTTLPTLNLSLSLFLPFSFNLSLSHRVQMEDLLSVHDSPYKWSCFQEMFWKEGELDENEIEVIFILSLHSLTFHSLSQDLLFNSWLNPQRDYSRILFQGKFLIRIFSYWGEIISILWLSVFSTEQKS